MRENTPPPAAQAPPAGTAPPWADPALMPPAPAPIAGRDHGVLGERGFEPCERGFLAGRVAERDRPALVWTPDSPRLRLPGEIDWLRPAADDRERRRLGRELREGALGTLFFGGIGLTVMASSRSLVILLPLLIALQSADKLLSAFVARRRLRADGAAYWAEEAVSARYGAWLERQRVRPPYALVVPIAAVGLLAVFACRSVRVEKAILAELTVQREAVLEGEWWRLASGGLLHIDPVHLAVNLLALVVLGRLLARLVGAARTAAWFAAAVLGGSLLSLADPRDIASLGASGGVCGLLGALAALGWRWRSDLPRAFNQWILRNLLLLALLSALAWQVLGHFAHLGGLLTGAALAALLPRGWPPLASGPAAMAAGGAAWAGGAAMAAWTGWRVGALAGWW